MFKANLFRAKLKEFDKTIDDMAVVLGISSATVSRKINGSSEFKRNEIQLLRYALKLSDDEVNAIFFAE
jgi:transcriptional regulator with XRE-family HTH domain